MGGSVPIDRSTTWPYEDGEPGEFSYARFSSPTVAEAERALGELDGGEALLFASGTAASAAVVLALLSPGQTVALAEGAYYGTGVLLGELERWGVRHVEFDQTGPPPPEADLVWIEAPSNPFLTMPDFEAAAAHSAPVVCDSTAATPLHVRPLELRVPDRSPLGDQGPGRPRRRPRRRAGDRRSRDGGAAARVPYPDGPDRRSRRRLASPARAADARSARRPPDRERHARSRSVSATIPPSRSSAIPGFGPLMSFDVADAERRHGASRPARG